MFFVVDRSAMNSFLSIYVCSYSDPKESKPSKLEHFNMKLFLLLVLIVSAGSASSSLEEAMMYNTLCDIDFSTLISLVPGPVISCQLE